VLPPDEPVQQKLGIPVLVAFAGAGWGIEDRFREHLKDGVCREIRVPEEPD